MHWGEGMAGIRCGASGDGARGGNQVVMEEVVWEGNGEAGVVFGLCLLTGV